MHPSPNQTRLSFVIFSFIVTALTFAACEMRLQIPSSSNGPDLPKYEFEATGEDFLISALDEVHAIADWSDSFQRGLSAQVLGSTLPGNKTLLTITGTDTVYIYGQIIPGGYGAVVTERYARPKGLLLITVRKTYGKGNGHIVTETKRYASYADHLGDNPQQTNVTELYGLKADTIVTHVLRNGTLQTYTFRLPVVTRVVSPQDGSIRVTSRYASNGQIISKVIDGDSNLVQLRRSYGQVDGSTVTRTEYPDNSWRQVRTRGEADGTITRETTSGLPSLGSGSPTTPANFPKPVMCLCLPLSSNDATTSTHKFRSTLGAATWASGVTVTPRPPVLVLASGVAAVPKPPILGPGPSNIAWTKSPHAAFASFKSSSASDAHRSSSGPVITSREYLLCSGLQITPPRPPLPVLA